MGKKKVEEVKQEERQTPVEVGVEILRAELDALINEVGAGEWTQEQREKRMELEGKGSEADRVISCGVFVPKDSEVANIDLPFSEEFMHNLPVFLTDVELGSYSKEQADLWREWGKLNQQKKDSAKAYGDAIKRVEDKLDGITRIVEEGSEERPVKCAWMFDYPQNEKILVRLDVNKIVELRTLTKYEIERYQSPELFGTEAVEQTEEATEALTDAVQGQEGAETEETGTVSEESTTTNPGLCVLKSDDVPCTGCDECQKTGTVEDLTEAGWPDPPPIDKTRNCCMPKDRAFHTEGNVRINYCTVCRRITNKEDVSSKPYTNIAFVVGSMFEEGVC